MGYIALRKMNREMKNGIKTICFLLILGLGIAIAGCSKKEPNEAQDIESVRADLREQVAAGKLTKEEAIVRLAEAIAKHDSDGKDKGKLSEELEALSKELKEKVASGEMSEEEATTFWIEATTKAKDKSNVK
jgi:polyhydroxyalkanoate synthesis regulator phasin